MTLVIDDMCWLVHNSPPRSHLFSECHHPLVLVYSTGHPGVFGKGLRDMVPVKLIMTSVEKIQTVDHDETIRRASQLMRDHKIGCLLVKKDDALGIVTETDLTRRVMAEGMNPEEELIERVMTTPILNIDAEATLLDANDLMCEKGIRHLGVEKNGTLVGLISVRDLVKFLTKYPRQ